MASLKDIQDEIANVLDASENGQLNEEQKAQVDGYLAELYDSRADKVDKIAQFFRLGKEEISALNAESKYIDRKKKSKERALAYMQTYILQNMQASGEKKINGKAYSLSVLHTPVVRIDNESAIPAEFWREKVERSVDKIAIRDAIKAGRDVAGASMGESISLQVR